MLRHPGPFIENSVHLANDIELFGTIGSGDWGRYELLDFEIEGLSYAWHMF